MEFPFKIGDKVIVKTGVNAYGITTPGSEGIITEIYFNYFMVSFSKLTSGYSSWGIEEYTFEADNYINFSLVTESTIDKSSKYYKVLCKVEQLKQKRKEQGYAY
jgi:hypothetical protein